MASWPPGDLDYCFFSDSGSVAVEVGGDEDYHFVLKAYGQSKNVIHIPTELVQVLDTMKEWFRTR